MAFSIRGFLNEDSYKVVQLRIYKSILTVRFFWTDVFIIQTVKICYSFVKSFWHKIDARPNFVPKTYIVIRLFQSGYVGKGI